jgi:CRP-like cAMP-binding protein
VPATLRAALASDEWFAACPKEMQDILLQLGRLRPLAHGQSLFSRGGQADGLCCVMAGGLHIGAINADGQLAELAFLAPYQWFGEIALIDGWPRTHDAVAEGGTQVLVVPRDALQDWLDRHPALWRELARLACRKLRVAFEVLEELAVLPLEERLQRRLRLLAQGYGSREAPRRRIRLGQEVLARMMGVSRQSVNKALRALETRGVLRLHYGEIELLG